MPQASDQLRAEMERRFGDPISDAGPMHYLIERGYRCQGGLWSRPETTTGNMPREDFDVLLFLIHEWDHDWKDRVNG